MSIIILAPLMGPIAAMLGIHPLHFGLITVLNLTVGHGTPPFGLCLFVASNIAKISLEELSKVTVPFLGVEIAVLLLVAYWPDVTLLIPKLLGYL